MKKLIFALLILCILASIFLGWVGHKRTLLQGLTYRLDAGAGCYRKWFDEPYAFGITMAAEKEDHRFNDAPKQNWWRISGAIDFMYGERRASVWFMFYRYHKGW